MSNLDVIKKSLTGPGMIETLKDAIPVADNKHINEMAKRFSKMAYTAIAGNSALQSCSVTSICKAVSQAASLDLDIDVRGLAYLVPYKTEAQFQIGYLGLMELAYRSNKVKSITAECIYASEVDSVSIERVDGKFTVIHPFSYAPVKGDIVAVYACAEVVGLGTVTEVMRIDEIERIRNKSKCPNSPAWKDWYPEMAKKTVIKKLLKFLPKSIVELAQQAMSYEDQHESFVDVKDVTIKQLKEISGTEIVEDEKELLEVIDENPDWVVEK